MRRAPSRRVLPRSGGRPVRPGHGPQRAPSTARTGLLADKLGSLGVGDQTQVVAYDDAGGMFAARLWWLLRWLGHSQRGGAQRRPAGLGVERSSPQSPRRPKPMLPRLHPQAAEWHEGRCRLRAAAIWAHPKCCSSTPVRPTATGAKTKPSTPWAGTFPGAINRFFKDNLGPDGCFKQASELQEEFGQDPQGGRRAHCSPSVRLRRNGLPQPARDGGCRT
jgi:thiosulfate/3-mercaptopyruvate sulfurtransferase